MSTKHPNISVAAARGVWLLRWLLVLLIAFDQVGSPLHRHHHDSGVDAAHWVAGAAGRPKSVGMQSLRESDMPGGAIFHANTAMRSEARLLLGSDSAAPKSERLVALIWPAQVLTPAALHARRPAPADDAPQRQAYWHGLIPEGRAPPMRA